MTNNDGTILETPRNSPYGLYINMISFVCCLSTDWELGRTYSSNTGTTFGRGASGSSTTTIIRELQGSADPHFVGVVRLRGAREGVHSISTFNVMALVKYSSIWENIFILWEC